MEVERATCQSGSKVESSSPKHERDQKATQATANTAMLKEFVRSRWCLSACKCNMLTGSCFGDVEEGGAKLDAPRMDLSRMAPPSQGASLLESIQATIINVDLEYMNRRVKSISPQSC